MSSGRHTSAVSPISPASTVASLARSTPCDGMGNAPTKAQSLPKNSRLIT